MLPLWPPTPGTYAIRMVRDGPLVAVRIWFGPPVIQGEEQDRSPRWCAEIDGFTDYPQRDRTTGATCRVPFDIERVWPWCAKHPIDQATYEYMVARSSWARRHNRENPAAKPRDAIDFTSLATPF